MNFPEKAMSALGLHAASSEPQGMVRKLPDRGTDDSGEEGRGRGGGIQQNKRQNSAQTQAGSGLCQREGWAAGSGYVVMGGDATWGLNTAQHVGDVS